MSMSDRVTRVTQASEAGENYRAFEDDEYYEEPISPFDKLKKFFTVKNAIILVAIALILGVSIGVSSANASNSASNSKVKTPSPTSEPTAAPSMPTYPPTAMPSDPSAYPTASPSTAVPSPKPTSVPSGRPTGPSAMPTARPTTPPLCCSTEPYYYFPWTECQNSANRFDITSCDTCFDYSCVDWIMGSHAMKQKEASFNATTGQKVYFAVGSYAYDTTRAGLCYRMTVQGLDRDIIGQVINIGGSILDGSFEAIMADGSFESGNGIACIPEFTGVPQYMGTKDEWNYLGALDPSRCSMLPKYPECMDVNKPPPDNLQDMCSWSFTAGLRNRPTITKMGTVACPKELYTMTGLHRADEPNPNYVVDKKTAGLYWENTGGQLYSVHDCAKPYYGWLSNMPKTLAYDKNYNLVVPCRRDGYTRING
eukprot:gene6175-8505_t